MPSVSNDAEGLTERPRRDGFEEYVNELAVLDASVSPSPEAPTSLPIDNLRTLPALFQPRNESLLYSPHASKAHVTKMLRVLRSGSPLDPVSVVSFGDRWYLVDGHHRLKAYREHGKLNCIPVTPCLSDKRGRDRVEWAVGLSVVANVKDKLSMSQQDKSDAAWRLTVLGYSKSATVAHSGVSDGLVGTMRRALRTLRKASELSGSLLQMGPTESLYSMSWRRASHEAERIASDLPDNFAALANFREAQMRKLTKSLTGTFNSRTDLRILVDALESIRPGVSHELRSLLDEDAETERASAMLNL